VAADCQGADGVSARATEEQGDHVPRLRRSDTSAPGLRRVRRGRGFRYLAADGDAAGPADVARIRALVIPPAWTEVWICPYPNGHLQATGLDAAGRRQYLYHEAWRARRDREKHDHVLEFAARLPAARERASGQLAGRGLGRDRVLAAAFTLLDVGGFRVGSDRYAEENGSYGLMTLLREHVRCERGRLTFEYPAKSGRESVTVVTVAPARAVVCALRRRRPPGHRLMAWSARGQWHDLGSDDVNDYLCDLLGVEVSAKDFRTWQGTVQAAVGLAVSGRAARSAPARKRAVSRVVAEVADYLGNTPAVCRRSYIDGRLIDRYLHGETIAFPLEQLGRGVPPGWPATHGPFEAAVLRHLAD
jgi:DNA topoisomerase IB